MQRERKEYEMNRRERPVPIEAHLSFHLWYPNRSSKIGAIRLSTGT